MKRATLHFTFFEKDAREIRSADLVVTQGGDMLEVFVDDGAVDDGNEIDRVLDLVGRDRIAERWSKAFDVYQERDACSLAKNLKESEMENS